MAGALFQNVRDVRLKTCVVWGSSQNVRGLRTFENVRGFRTIEDVDGLRTSENVRGFRAFSKRTNQNPAKRRAKISTRTFYFSKIKNKGTATKLQQLPDGGSA